MSSLAECTAHCRSRQHADELIAVITSSAPEGLIKAYVRGHCHRAGQVTDRAGRTLLHVAAACGRTEVLEWLLEEGRADRQAKDAESGWTALHRSVFYGQLFSAVKLIQFGASLRSTDHEDLTPLDLAVKDKLPHIEHSPENPSDVYTWGTNSNFTLGHSNQQSRASPDVIDELIRRKVTIKQVCINKFHSVFLATNGRVFTCGHGQGGRLGHGGEETRLRPSLVQGLTGTCISIATARDHTLFQMEDGSIYGCGENKFGQLGMNSDQENFLKPKQVLDRFFFSDVASTIVAAKFHSIFYTKDQVFTCGLNGGQLGHAKDIKLMSTPKLVTTLNHAGMAICQVAASDGVTACRTENGDVYLLQNYVCRKIINKRLSINKMVVVGGTLSCGPEKTATKKKIPVTIVMLHKNGRLLSWQSTDGTLRRCVTNRRRQIFYKDVALSEQGLLLVTTEGEAYKGHFTHKKAASLYDSSMLTTDGAARQGFIQIGGVEQVDKEKSEMVNIQRVNCLHRVTKVACDPKGLNFSALANNPRLGLTDIPEVGPSRLTADLKRLYAECSTADNIHDIEITVGRQVFPAHKLILAHRSEHFRKVLTNIAKGAQTDEVHIELSQLNRNVLSIDMTRTSDPEVMRRILTYLYTDSCDLFDWGFAENLINLDRKILSRRSPQIDQKGNKGRKKGGKKKKKAGASEGDIQGCEPEYLPVMQAVKDVKDAAKLFGIPALFHRLELVKMRGSRLDNFRPAENQSGFDRSQYEALSDIILESEDGVLFHCHRCVLVARLDYFNSMLASGWLEASSKAPLKLPIHADVLGILLDFVYTSRTPPALARCTDMELVCNILVTADQLLLPRLKEITETILVDMISLRNVSQLLEFAAMYQAPQLKAACHQFITINIVYILESQSLEDLSDDVMVELTKAYRGMVPGMNGRVITPYSTAPTPDELAALLEGPTHTTITEDVISSAKARRKERRKSSLSYSSDTERANCSESHDGDTRGQSATSYSEEVILNAKARRKARRRSSDKFSRGSEGGDIRHSESLNEEIEKHQLSGPGGDAANVSEIKESSVTTPEENHPRQTLVQMFDGNREKWTKVQNPGSRRENLDGGRKTAKAGDLEKGRTEGANGGARTSENGGVAPMVNGHAHNDRATSEMKDLFEVDTGIGAEPLGKSMLKGKEPLTNGGLSKAAENGMAKRGPKGSAVDGMTASSQESFSGDMATGGESTAKRPEKEVSSANIVHHTPEELPGDGKWLKKGQRVAAVPKSAKTPTAPLHISVSHPWQSPVITSPQGAGLKDIMAAEMAALTRNTPKAIGPASSKKPQTQQSRQQRQKPVAIEAKPAWSGWSKPVSPPLPDDGFVLPSSEGEDSFSSKKVSFGDMFEMRSQHDSRKQPQATSSPVSPRSPDHLSVWGASEPSPKESEPRSLSFTQIIKAEEQAERNLDKAMNKSLQSIQIEEQAMQELLEMYRLAAGNEEYITVEQVKVTLANPHWSKTIT